jgi:hypothetical protein
MSQLIPALAGLAPIAAGVGLIALFGHDPHADEHDLSDYHEADEVTPSIERLTRADLTHIAAVTGGLKNREVVAEVEDDDILPPAPPGTNAGGSPLYRATHVAAMFRDFDAAAIAREVLQNLGDKARLEVTR